MGNVDMCLNCTRARCTGECELIRGGRKPRKPAAVYEAFGRTMTLRAWSEKSGISVNALYQRIKNGYTMEAALEKGVPKPQRGPVTAFGQTMPLRAWARKSGIQVETLRYRILVAGMSPEEAMRRGRPVKRYGGRTVKQWAEALGVSVHTIYARIHQGWTIEEIAARYGGKK